MKKQQYRLQKMDGATRVAVRRTKPRRRAPKYRAYLCGFEYHQACFPGWNELVPPDRSSH